VLKKTSNVDFYAIDMIEHEQLKRSEVEFFYTTKIDKFWILITYSDKSKIQIEHETN
jgi:hypothetical protein